MRTNRGKAGRNGSDNGTSGKEKMMKFIPLVILVLAIVVFIVYNIWPENKVTTLTSVAKIEPTKPNKPSRAIIYLDNSSSMEGYVHGDEYIYAMSSLFGVYDTTIVLGINSGDTITSGSDLVDVLKNGDMPYKGQSLLDEDLANVVKTFQDSARRGEIAFYVTDGIMCGPDSAVKAANENDFDYNVAHKIDLMNSIAKVFSGKGLAVSVYRLISNFDGLYYCSDNEHKKIHHSRSFYIIAIGKPEVVAHFKQRLAKLQGTPGFEIRPCNEIHFIDTMPVNQSLTVNSGMRGEVILHPDTANILRYDWRKVKDTGFINFLIGSDAFSNFTSSSISVKGLADSVRVEINGTLYSDIPVSFDSIRNSLRVSLDLNRLNASKSGDIVRIYIPYFTPNWICDSTFVNEDDKFMIQGSPDESTFLFYYFIHGIMKGIIDSGGQNGKSRNIYDCEIILKRING